VVFAEERWRLHELIVLNLHSLQSRDPSSLSLTVQIVLNKAHPSLFIFGELDGSHRCFREVSIEFIFGELELWRLLQPDDVLRVGFRFLILAIGLICFMKIFSWRLLIHLGFFVFVAVFTVH